MMVVPQFMRFYRVTVDQSLDEFAVRFFALANAMFRLKSQEQIDDISSFAVAQRDPQSAIAELEKSSKGLHGILEEVEVVKRVKKK